MGVEVVGNHEMAGFSICTSFTIYNRHDVFMCTSSHRQLKNSKITHLNKYRIAQNSGGEKLWRISDFKVLTRKTLVNA